MLGIGTEDSQYVVVMAWNVDSLGPEKTQSQFKSNVRKSNANVIILIGTGLHGNLEDCFRKMWEKGPDLIQTLQTPGA